MAETGDRTMSHLAGTILSGIARMAPGILVGDLNPGARAPRSEGGSDAEDAPPTWCLDVLPCGVETRPHLHRESILSHPVRYQVRRREKVHPPPWSRFELIKHFSWTFPRLAACADEVVGRPPNRDIKSCPLPGGRWKWPLGHFQGSYPVDK